MLKRDHRLEAVTVRIELVPVRKSLVLKDHLPLVNGHSRSSKSYRKRKSCKGVESSTEPEVLHKKGRRCGCDNNDRYVNTVNDVLASREGDQEFVGVSEDNPLFTHENRFFRKRHGIGIDADEAGRTFQKTTVADMAADASDVIRASYWAARLKGVSWGSSSGTDKGSRAVVQPGEYMYLRNRTNVDLAKLILEVLSSTSSGV
jgi:hypothetical protein